MPANLDQSTLQQLAKECTNKYFRKRFEMSAQAKRLGRRARLLMSPYSWKSYHRLVRQERRLWQEQLTQQACQDWESFRVFHSAKRKCTSWAPDMTIKAADDPFVLVTEHFKGTFQKPDGMPEENMIRELINATSGNGEPLSDAEVRQAVMAGKLRKSPGPDEVPLELLRVLAVDPQGIVALTAFFQKSTMDCPRRFGTPPSSPS